MINQGRDSGFNKSKIINRRMFIFSGIKTIIFFGIIGRLFSLQINENKKYPIIANRTIVMFFSRILFISKIVFKKVVDLILG